MIQLTQDQADSLHGFFEAAPNQILKHGDTGYFQDDDGLVIIQCCPNCGEYTRVTINPSELLSFCASNKSINFN
jgi:hypothetical protein